MDRIFIYLIDLPPKVHEMVTPCADGYTIYINARLSEYGRAEALDHAMWHINHNDFEREDVEQIEYDVRRRNEKDSNLYAGQFGEAGP